MSALVLDASVVVDLVLARSHPALDAALEREAFVTVGHLDVEVLSALARMRRRDELTDQEVAIAIDDLAAMAVQRVMPSLLTMRRAWAMRHNVTMADGLYLAVAEHLGSVVVTADRRLRRAAPELTVAPDELVAG